MRMKRPIFLPNLLIFWFKSYFHDAILPVLRRQGVGFISSVLLSAIFLRGLGFEQFGFWAYLVAILSIPNSFSQPIITSMLRFLPEQTENEKFTYFVKYVQLAFMTWLVLYLLVGLFIFLPADFSNIFSFNILSRSEYILILLILIIKFFFEFVSFCTASYSAALFEIARQQNFLAIKRIVETTLLASMIILLDTRDHILLFTALLMCVCEFLGLIYWLRWLRSGLLDKNISSIRHSPHKIIEISSFILPLSGIQIVSFLGKRAGIFLFGYFGLMNEVALLAVIDKMFSLANKFPSNLLNALLPYYSRLSKNKNLKLILSYCLSVGYGIAGNILFFTAVIWLQIWGITLTSGLETAVCLLSINLVSLGFLQISSQEQFQKGNMNLAFRVTIVRRSTFFIMLCFINDSLIDVILCETFGILAGATAYVISNPENRLVQIMTFGITLLASGPLFFVLSV